MISTDALQVGFLSSLTIVNERLSLTIVNETIVLKTTIFKNEPFKKMIVFRRRFHNETIVFPKN